jgi:hypothetical protein
LALTPFPGIAYVASQGSDGNNISVITDWPGGGRAHEYLEKVPSQIAYVTENKKASLQEDAWGYEVQPGMVIYCWTKLLLDSKTIATEHDDPSLKEASGGGALRLPPGKTAGDVVADYLRFLYENCMDRLEKKMTKDILNVTPIEFWFTVPAIWSDEAKNATRNAASKAGFGTRPSDKINMIAEPEAAALAALKATRDSVDDLLKVGCLYSRCLLTDRIQINTGVLVCDCGGGTVVRAASNLFVAVG